MKEEQKAIIQGATCPICGEKGFYTSNKTLDLFDEGILENKLNNKSGNFKKIEIVICGKCKFIAHSSV